MPLRTGRTPEARLSGREAEHWTPVLGDARRTRGAIAGGISCEDPSETQSFIDRADAVGCALAACYRPRMAALVAEAQAVLGYVVRDAGLVRAWLERVDPADAAVRHALVVALGMIGASAPLELAWPNPADVEDATAYYAHLAFGTDDEEERVDLAFRADMWARGMAREFSEKVLGWMESGIRLAVVG